MVRAITLCSLSYAISTIDNAPLILYLLEHIYRSENIERFSNTQLRAQFFYTNDTYEIDNRDRNHSASRAPSIYSIILV